MGSGEPYFEDVMFLEKFGYVELPYAEYAIGCIGACKASRVKIDICTVIETVETKTVKFFKSLGIHVKIACIDPGVIEDIFVINLDSVVSKDSGNC